MEPVMSAAIRTAVLQLFETHRVTPGAPYDKSHFLDFLLAKPEQKGAVYNSFRGALRFGNFLEDVKLALGICFSLKDRDANYSLDRFVARAAELQRSRRGSLKSLENQVRSGPGWNFLILVDALLLSIGAFVKSNAIAFALLIVTAVVVNVGFLFFAWRSRAYLNKLRARLERR